MNIRERVPVWLRKLSRIFRDNGFSLYIVGGFVRNALLGISESDMDITGPAQPEMAAAFLQREDNIKVVPKAVQFGTVEIHIYEDDSWNICEYTTFRKDYYREGGKHIPEKVQFTESMQDDAYRRDFSMNALYYDIERDCLYDPVGGNEHIHQGIVSTTTKDPLIIFQDDGLRILRMVRFACELGFTMDRASYDAAHEKIHLLQGISKERIRDEFTKILLSDIRYPAIQKDDKKKNLWEGLYALFELGAFFYIVPQLLEGVGVEQRKEYHKYDVFNHGLEACVAAPPVLHLRLAGLLHDIAKPFLSKETGRMAGHDRKGAEMVKDILGQDGLRYGKKTVTNVSLLIKDHMFDLDNQAKPSTVRRKFIDMGIERAEELIELRKADKKASGLPWKQPSMIEKWENVLIGIKENRTPTSLRDLDITGRDIMNILNEGSSQRIGKVKKALFDWVIEHPDQNQFDCLVKRMEDMVKKGIIP